MCDDLAFVNVNTTDATTDVTAICVRPLVFETKSVHESARRALFRCNICAIGKLDVENVVRSADSRQIKRNSTGFFI